MPARPLKLILGALALYEGVLNSPPIEYGNGVELSLDRFRREYPLGQFPSLGE
jgi:hypothetical protein